MSPFGSMRWQSVTIRGWMAAESAEAHGISVEINRSRSALFGSVTSEPSRRRPAVFSTRGWSDVTAGSFLAAGKICEHALAASNSSKVVGWRMVMALV
jgi:hypothetical protein